MVHGPVAHTQQQSCKQLLYFFNDFFISISVVDQRRTTSIVFSLNRVL